MNSPLKYAERSQDLETNYHDAGQVYWYKQISLEREVTDGLRIRPVVRPALEVQDIDTEIDWKLAELKFSLFKEIGNV